MTRALTCIIAAVLLAGCGSPQPTLTIAINAGVEGDALKAAAAEWGARNRTRVDIVELPYANLFEKELLDLTSRTGAYDIIMMDDPWFPRMVENGQLAALEKQPDGDFLASCLDVCREPYRTGAFYALPYVGNSQLFFYRKDLFDQHGMDAPATWNDVLAAAKKIGTAEKMFGYVMRAAPGNAVITDFMPLFWAFGAEMFDSEGHTTVATPQAVECVRFMLELGKYSPPGYTGFNADEVSGHLLQSTAVMSINWPAWIAAMDDPARSKIPGKIAFAQMPSARRKGVAELGSWLLGIPSGSKNKQRAVEFLFWATAGQQMRQAALRGNPPTRRSVFLDAELRARFRAFPAQLASLETARPRPRTPLWNEIENAFGIRISQANAGSLTTEEALQRANQEIEAIVQRAK
jgi:multiple sugar transport system substrate-binding protein